MTFPFPLFWFKPVFVTRILPLLLLVLMLVTGLALGLWITRLSLSSPVVPGSIRNGPWVMWPKAGAPDADPYSLATHARRGDVPMAQGEGIALFAFHDSDSKPLDGACTYEVRGHFPPARIWSVAVYHPDGRQSDNAAGRRGLTSHEAIVEDGQNRIRISASPMPGNWLPVSGQGAFVLVLRFYETPLSAAASALDWSRMPTLERKACPA